VALPRETVLIKNGDLYLGISPSRLISKTLPMIQEMIIPLYRARFDNTFFMDWEEHSSGRADCFSISSDGLLCHASPETGASSADLLFTTKRGAIYNDYLTEGNRLHEGRYPINDLAMHLEIQPLADSGFLYGELREAGDTFRFQLNSKSAGGGGSLVHEVGTAVAHHIAIPTRLFPGFTPSKTYDLTFMNIDNQVFLLCNSLELAKLSYPENSDLFNSAYKNVPLIGADSTSVLFRKIDFDRDVYYCDDMGTFAVKQPYSIPEGHYFFLGDNSAQSEDSRFFGPIPREDLIGKPFLLFYPFSRIRLF
ncbi:MAG: signal peptidase I, partial [Planctomycetota bacterium]